MDESTIATTNVSVKDGMIEPDLKSFTKVREDMIQDWKDGTAKAVPHKLDTPPAEKRKIIWTDAKGTNKIEINLNSNQSFYEFKWDKEKAKEVIEEMRTNSNQPACAIIEKHNKCIDKGNPLIQDLDTLWYKMGEVFPEYKVANTDAILELMKSKLPNLKVSWINQKLCVNAAATNIGKDEVRKAFDGLKGVTSERSANKIIAGLLAKKIRKLFG